MKAFYTTLPSKYVHLSSGTLDSLLYSLRLASELVKDVGRGAHPCQHDISRLLSRSRRVQSQREPTWCEKTFRNEFHVLSLGLQIAEFYLSRTGLHSQYFNRLLLLDVAFRMRLVSSLIICDPVQPLCLGKVPGKP